MLRAAARPVAMVLGILAILQFFVPHRAGRWVEARLVDWLVLLEAAALVAGVMALARRHVVRCKAGGSDRLFSSLTLGAMGITLLAGLLPGEAASTTFDTLYEWVLQPIQSTMLSLLAFYMASAVFRSFRFASAPATILLISAVTVLLARVPMGEEMVPRISVFSTWIIRGPNVAATRGVWIGIGLAACATAFRVILGIQGPTGGRRS